jgi:RNA polymerase sigma-70 factor, ECF subfamily
LSIATCSPPAPRRDWDWAALGRRSRAEALRVLGDPCTADEAAQEALTRAWRQRHSCRTPGTPGAWVAQIARNEALRLRAGEKKQCDMAARAQIAMVGTSPPAEDGLISKVSVQQALAGLTLEERRLIDLRYKDDLAQPAIAKLLGLPEGTVKVRLHRLRKRLRKVITEEP